MLIMRQLLTSMLPVSLTKSQKQKKNCSVGTAAKTRRERNVSAACIPPTSRQRVKRNKHEQQFNSF